jgi:hypothetical protein
MEGSIWISVPNPNLPASPPPACFLLSVLEILLMVLVVAVIKAPYKREIL